MKIKLYYDNECPFCSRYSHFVQIRKKHDIRIIKAREAKAQMAQFKAMGYDINTGMIAEADNKIYHGADCARFLDSHLQKTSHKDKLLSLIVRMPGFKKISYPSVKLLRKLWFKIIGKQLKI